MSQGDRTYDANFVVEFYKKIHGTETAHELYSLVKRAASIFGFNYYSIIYLPEAVDTQFRPHFVSIDWPEGLLAEYDNQDLLANSPIIKKLRSDRTPVSFDLDTIKLDRPDRELPATLEMFHKYKMPRGIYYPCFDSRGRKGAVNFAGERALPTAEETPILHMLSSYAFNRLHMLLKNDFTNAELTKREKECLALAARGKTIIESSNSLGISENTVAGYLATTSKKLSARNKAHMIAIAYENGLLSRHDNE
jgi:LuxR family transcriptional regulator, quorum-sensing system regulator BjaR1